MKKLLIVAIGFFLVNVTSAQTFTLKSSDLTGQFTNKNFGNIFGSTGENVSPELQWENAPTDTKAYAVTMYDPDAPTESGFWHWIVYNIPASVTKLETGAGNSSPKNLPAGALSGKNDAGSFDYLGPCPPPGPAHAYVITVYALKAPIQVDENTSAAVISFMLNMNTIAKASIISYGKKE